MFLGRMATIQVMSTYSDSQVNHNDNFSSSWLVRDGRTRNADYARHIPLANWLIKNHCKMWWKTQPQTSEYQYVQFAICCQLCHPQTKELTLKTIAMFLECNPIALINDLADELNALD